MILEFAGKNLDVATIEKEQKLSPSTGKQLNTYSVQIEIIGKVSFSKFQDLIKKHKKDYFRELDNNGNVIRKFLMGNSSYSYRGADEDEDTLYYYTMEIIEQEELITNVLIIAGISCNVLTYNEEIDKSTGAIIINAVIEQTESDREKIKSSIGDSTYFDVIRVGINDAAIKMRFGKTIWSSHDGLIKRKIVLVQENYDVEDRKNNRLSFGFNEPELSNIEKMLAQQIKYSTLLENILIDKGIVSADDMSQLKKQVSSTYRDIYINYYMVDDVEKYD